MPAAITDKFNQATNGTRPVPTTLTATRAIGASSITVGALTGWPTATAVHFSIYQVDTSGNKVAGSQTDWKGTASGTTISNLTLEAGSDSGDSVGAIVECGPTAAWANDVVDGILVEHDQDGTHGDINADSITATTGTFTNLTIAGTATPEGWSALGATPDTVTALGNRSYSMVFNGTDLTDTLSPGMRLKMTRTVAAPTQCTSLNGTTQYFNKTSPNKLTFTDDFVCSAWVKLTSYATSGIITRYNGTSGWILSVNSVGQVQLTGYNGGVANYSQVQSYHTLPLNKWVHIAAQLDMSAFTATTTTSYVMIDGLDTPASVSRGGTNPTALVQAGNLEIGTYNAGGFFPGKIAQVAVYSAKVTQATILASIDRTLTGSETSLASAYSFNNSIADLNTTTPNDLTAQGSAVATNADSPFAQDAQGVPTGTTEYAIVTKTAFSTNTTLTVQCPEGGAIPSTGGVSAISYSTHRVPYGFISDKGKWSVVTYMNKSAAGAFGSINVWYTLTGNAGKLVVPIGRWTVGYQWSFALSSTVAGIRSGYFTMASTAPTNAVYYGYELSYRLYTNASTGTLISPAFKQTSVNHTSEATYYPYAAIDSATGTETFSINGEQGYSFCFAECDYV